MKKYIAFTFIFAISLFLFGCSNKDEQLTDLDIIKQRGYIIVGVKGDSPPFGYYDKDNKLKGLDIDIAKAIAQNIFNNDSLANVQFEVVNAQNRIAKLNSKKVDILVATMSVNDKRKLILDFSTPYFVASQKIIVKKTSDIKNLRYFNKQGKIAVIMGTTGEKILRVVAPNADVIGAKTYSEAFEYLKNNQVDAILGDDCILKGFQDDNYKIINRPYSKEFYAVAVRKSNYSKELLNQINAAIINILDSRHINIMIRNM